MCIYVVNIFGAVLLSVVAAGNVWRFQRRNIDYFALLIMLILGFLNCIIDPLVFTAEGQSGKLAYYFNIFGNSWLYASNMTCSFLWFVFLSQHICGGVSKVHRSILKVAATIGALGVIVNFFYPFIFVVSENNEYERLWGYWMYTVIDYGVTLDSIIICFWRRLRNRLLTFFPIWVYLFPLMIGTFAQTFIYGISTITAGLAIAIAGVFSSLQNEQIFRDRLTGLYNRSYLDYYLRTFSRRHRESVLIGLMLDLNSFKKINDNFGHSVGDRALINMADILRKSTRKLGVVIRYAGDEFIILLNTQDPAVIDRHIQTIYSNLTRFNRSSKEPYQLSTSIGKGVLDLKTDSLDDFINKIDHEMYENKKAYYAANTGNDRRHR